MDNTYNVSVCVDCMIVNEYGKMAEGVPTDHINAMTEGMAGGTLDVDTTSHHFSSMWCDICRTNLGGDRYDGQLTMKNEAS